MDKKIAVIFDLDDTLYSKSEVFFKTFCQFATPSIDAESLYLTYQKRSDEAFENFLQEKSLFLNRIKNEFPILLKM